MRIVGVALIVIAVVCAGLAFVDINMRGELAMIWVIAAAASFLGGLIALVGAKLEQRR